MCGLKNIGDRFKNKSMICMFVWLSKKVAIIVVLLLRE